MPIQTFPYTTLGVLLSAHGLRLVTAESCSGGLLGHLITNTPGSSGYYLGGFTSYSNQAKQAVLGVQASTLELYGAVSRETVLEMAMGARLAFRDFFSTGEVIALSTSGIAGPGGGSALKPVGTVWIGLSSPAGQEAHAFLFHGGREEIKLQSALEALRLLLEHLQ